jgi:hypothetical protein
LFATYGGRTVPNDGVEFPPGFDYAFVTVALDYVRIRFQRGRNELSVKIAPSFAPDEWHELSLVISALDGSVPGSRRGVRDLWHVARLLESKVNAISAVFSSPERFAAMGEELEAEVYSRDRALTEAWQDEINRSLYDK